MVLQKCFRGNWELDCDWPTLQWNIAIFCLKGPYDDFIRNIDMTIEGIGVKVGEVCDFKSIFIF